MERELREAYAGFMQELKEKNIILGNGSDEMLSLAISKNIYRRKDILL